MTPHRRLRVRRLLRYCLSTQYPVVRFRSGISGWSSLRSLAHCSFALTSQGSSYFDNFGYWRSRCNTTQALASTQFAAILSFKASCTCRSASWWSCLLGWVRCGSSMKKGFRIGACGKQHGSWREGRAASLKLSSLSGFRGPQAKAAH